MSHAGIGWRRIKSGLVRLAGALGAVVAVFRDVFAFDDGEGVADIGGGGAGDAVEVSSQPSRNRRDSSQRNGVPAVPPERLQVQGIR